MRRNFEAALKHDGEEAVSDVSMISVQCRVKKLASQLFSARLVSRESSKEQSRPTGIRHAVKQRLTYGISLLLVDCQFLHQHFSVFRLLLQLRLKGHQLYLHVINQNVRLQQFCQSVLNSISSADQLSAHITRCRAIAGRTARCRCKFRFTTAPCSFLLCHSLQQQL